MKKSLLVLFLITLFTSLSFAQTLLVEDFNYNVGDLLTAKGWTLSSGTTNPLTVTSPGLTFTGYPSVVGNACTLTSTGEDDYKTFTAVSSGSIYLAFLMNVQSAQTGDYFIAFSPTTSQTNYYARTHLKLNGSGYSIGISKSNELSGGYVYGNTVLAYNKTYVAVVKHTFNAATTDDDAEYIYVFATTIPTTEPTTAEVGPHVYSAKTDPTDLGYITLRQGSTSLAPSMIIDGVRIATSWKDLLVATDVKENSLPTKFELSQNYPNPFNPETSISYQVSENTNVSLKIYDVLGNEVSTLVNEVKQPGTYNVKFNGAGLASGLYFYKMTAGNFSQVKKMMLMK